MADLSTKTARKELKSRIDRWYSGEKVEGQDKMYTDGNPLLARVVFVDSENRNAA